MSAPARSEFVTTDPDEACARLSSAYSALKLAVVGNRADFRFSHVSHDLESVRLDRLRHSIVTKVAGEPIGTVIVCRVLEHAVELDSGAGFRRFGAGDVFLCQAPDRGYRSTLFGVDTEAVSIEVPFLRRIAGHDLAASSRLPDRGFGEPIPAHLARAWLHAVRYVHRGVLNDPTAAASPLVVDSARRLLAATVLAMLEAPADPHPVDSRDATSGTVERAVAFIEANPDLNIGVTDIARAAYVTPRAVQLAFRRHLDTTPTAYLRRVRLEHARDELLDADPAVTTVTAIAGRWGFTSSRFATLYRETFHELPNETLRR